jgi:hypothetical protein
MTVETAPRRTEYLPLDHLTPDEANPKAHDLRVIDESVGRFGIIDQIVRDDRTGYIISGHGRHAALTLMRDRCDNPPEGVRVDAGGHWLVPVIVGWASRTDSEARAALIALNRTTELGGWVDDELLALLDDLTAEGDHGLVGVGYGEDDIDALRQRLAADALVDKFTARQGEEAADGDTDLGRIALVDDVREITVVVPTERYEDFYALMHETEWVKDVRDKIA